MRPPPGSDPNGAIPSGDAPPPPDGTPQKGPVSPSTGPLSTKPRHSWPNRPSEPVEVWSPFWSTFVRRILLAAIVLVPVIFLASWSYAGPSQNLCGGCHDSEAAAASSVSAVHREVPCLSCHHRSGLLGAITYYPTLLRESVHKTTGLPLARGVLKPRTCESCHEEVVETDGHRDLAISCLDCHTDAAHPSAVGEVTPTNHPIDYFQLHGRDAVPDAATCTECHAGAFCQACHTQSSFPHPDGWGTDHGSSTVAKGTASCESCHPQSFCEACHGSGVPHSDNWLSEHNTSSFAEIAGCGACHEIEDCSACHARHSVHREQSLYDLESAP